MDSYARVLLTVHSNVYEAERTRGSGFLFIYLGFHEGLERRNVHHDNCWTAAANMNPKLSVSVDALVPWLLRVAHVRCARPFLRADTIYM